MLIRSEVAKKGMMIYKEVIVPPFVVFFILLSFAVFVDKSLYL